MLPLRDRLPTRRAPIVNYLILATNVLVFLWERALITVGYPASRLLFDWGLVPGRFTEAPLVEASSVVTSMFMHDPSGWFHIGGNMLYLWIFGDNVEDAMGRGRYALFYFCSGLAAAGAQILIDPGSPIPMVGASGAIAGVLAAYGSLYPKSPITVLNPFLPLWFIFGLFIELPAWFIILEFFFMNLLSGIGALGAQGGGVAFFAHIGGFVAGLFMVRLFMIDRTPRDHDRWKGWRPPPRRAPPRGPYDDPYTSARPRRREPWDGQA